MNPYLRPPKHLPIIPRFLLWIVEKSLGRELMANRILTWYPKALLGSGLMEALVYTRCISRTPLSFEAETIAGLKRHFSDRAIVIIASTCAQVNFWARCIQAFGVPPAGFTESCSILDLESYRTDR